MLFRKKLLLAATLAAVGAAGSMPVQAGPTRTVTIVHTGDFHGHLAPRPNVRSDGDGRMEGGLARIYKQIDMIRADKGNIVLVHGGDTIQGSGEALYTKGDAMVTVMDNFGYDAYTPGNWDFVYGKDRFVELWGPGSAGAGKNRWGAVVANVYHTGVKKSGHEGAPDAPLNTTNKNSAQGENVSKAESEALANWYFEHGVRVANGESDPTIVKTINGAKVGIIGCTTTRGPQVVGSWVSNGLSYTDCGLEVPYYAAKLRNVENVDLVVLVSEIEIGRNIQLARSLSADAHVDVIFNSDMHEETLKPIEVSTAGGKTTLIVEEGMDGTMIGELTFSVKNHVVTGSTFTPHRISDRIEQDSTIAYLVAKESYPFNKGFDYAKAKACADAALLTDNDAKLAAIAGNPYVNPLSVIRNDKNLQITCLNGPLSEVVGNTAVALHRSNFATEDMPAVVEGSSHDLIADAIRWWAQSDFAAVRGFRYGTTVKPGAITRNDIYHFVPIGARIGKASRVAANQMRNQIDNSSRAVFSSNPGDDRILMPRYNNTYGAPKNADGTDNPNYTKSPGAGLPASGAAGAPEGFGGGWLFAYSAGEGFGLKFAPYFNDLGWVDNGDNTYTLSPGSNRSRARDLTFKVICKVLPPAEIASTGCSLSDTETRYVTHITTLADGSYVGSWKSPYTATQINANYSDTVNNANAATPCQAKVPADAGQTSCGYTPWLLNPDGWRYLNGVPNQPNSKFTVNQHFKAGLFTVAGYFYGQYPNTLNNCNNCYATGKVDGGVAGNMSVADPDVAGHKLLNPDVAFLLPVNATTDTNGNIVPALDGNKNPLLVQDASNGVDGLARDYDNKPMSAGRPIALTEVVELYVKSLGTVTESLADGDGGNLRTHRIKLVHNDGSDGVALPDSLPVTGFKTMQPLCGTLAKKKADGTYQTEDEAKYDAEHCPQ